MSYSGFNWLRALVLPITATAMEATWLFLWVLILSRFVRAAAPTGFVLLSPASVFAIIFAGAICTRRLLRSSWEERRIQAAAIVLGVGAAFLIAQIEQGTGGWLSLSWIAGPLLDLPEMFAGPSPRLAALLVALLLWWRGMGLGNGLDPEDVMPRFWTGLAATIAALGWVSLSEDASQHVATMGGYLLAFFFFGLFSLALARLEQVRSRRADTDDHSVGLNHHWLVSVLGTILGVVVLSFLLAQLVAVDVLTLLATPLGILGRLLDAILFLVLLPFGLLVEILLSILIALLRNVRPQPNEQEPNLLADDLERLREQTTQNGLPPEILLILKWLLAIALVVGVLLLLRKAASRLRQTEDKDEAEEERDSVWSGEAFLAAFLAWLRRLKSRLFQRRDLAATQQSGIAAKAIPLSPAISSVREVYRALLQMAASLGLPRQPSETPYEYLVRSEPTLSPEGDELAAITTGYVEARYSPDPPSESVVRSVVAAWRALRARLDLQLASADRGRRGPRRG